MTDTNTCRVTDTCRLKNYLYRARQSFLNTLNEYTLADTVGSLHGEQWITLVRNR